MSVLSVESSYYLRNRYYYDPATAQFLTRDPLEAETRAPYSYASDNPLNMTDPLGLDDCGNWFFNAFCDVGHVATGAWNATGGQAVHFVASHTIGVCLNFSGGFGAFGQAEGCVASVGGTPTFMGTLGGGGSSPTASITGGLLISNAAQPCQVRGPFGFAGGSADLGLSVGDQVSVGESQTKKLIWENETNVGVGVDFPIPFEYHGGASYTWTWSP